jgi:hypothetical protein
MSINGQIHLTPATTSERTSINGHVHLALALHKNSGRKDRREVVRATRRQEGGGYLSRPDLRPAAVTRRACCQWYGDKAHVEVVVG